MYILWKSGRCSQHCWGLFFLSRGFHSVSSKLEAGMSGPREEAVQDMTVHLSLSWLLYANSFNLITEIYLNSTVLSIHVFLTSSKSDTDTSKHSAPPQYRCAIIIWNKHLQAILTALHHIRLSSCVCSGWGLLITWNVLYFMSMISIAMWSDVPLLL